MVSQLEQIQCLLQDIGSNIATPRDLATAPRLARTEFDSDGQHVQDLEQWIDTMDQELPPLTSFILPVSQPWYLLHGVAYKGITLIWKSNSLGMCFNIVVWRQSCGVTTCGPFSEQAHGATCSAPGAGAKSRQKCRDLFESTE